MRAVVLASLAAVALVAAALAVALSRGEDEPAPAPLAGSAAVAQLLEGIPQDGVVLGAPDAPVLVTEVGDLQCAGCAALTTGPLAQVIREHVRAGRVRLAFRHYALLGPESARAARAALAASLQGRHWHFVEVLFANRPPAVNAGLITPAFLEAVARSAGVDLGRWRAAISDPRWAAHLRGAAQLAQRLELDGVPAVTVTGPGRDTTFRRAPALARLQRAIAAARGA